jgi:hypothetical protein
MRQICFLFNHDQIHQVAHSLPIALRLVQLARVEVTLAFSEPSVQRYVQVLAGSLYSRFQTATLELRSAGSRTFAAALNGLIPARKLALYRDNLEFFRKFDALVVSEKTSLLLKSRYGLSDLKLIHTRHGAGDRAIGFNRESAMFDLVLVSGPKIARRLMIEAGLNADRIRIVGYPKFDLFADRKLASPFPATDLPTVLYAPHPSPKLSSYYRMGSTVIEAIVRSGRFNLIFAPHVMLFKRQWTVSIAPPAIAWVPQPDRALMASDNVLFDPGSERSSDMTYTNMADLYVGDVSSQVYEFLAHSRPCLHLNAHAVRWRGDSNFAHWTTGPVMGPDDDVLDALDLATATFPQYEETQRALIADTFDMTGEPAGLRAAKAVLDFLDER